MAEGAIIALVNQNLDEWHQELCDWSLPSTFYFHGPWIMANEVIAVTAPREISDVSGDETLSETFRRIGKSPIRARILPTAEFPHPGEHADLDRGYYPTGKLIVPDRLKWGELIRWCSSQGDMTQSNFYPIATAPEKKILEYLEKNYPKRG